MAVLRAFQRACDVPRIAGRPYASLVWELEC
jgi:hypothetical protein